MARITIVTRIRFLAALAPLVALIAAPIIAGGFYVFGGQIESVHDTELAATQAARGMDVALYQMEWARTQRDSEQILIDQRRAFANWLAQARDRAESDDQRKIIADVAQQAEPLFAELRNSSPADESAGRKTRELHGRIADLIGADDQVLLDLAAASRSTARRLALATFIAALAIPWLCFAAIYAAGGRLRTELRAIRQSFEDLRERTAGASPAAAGDLDAIDQSLARLGFPKPNPMLAE